MDFEQLGLANALLLLLVTITGAYAGDYIADSDLKTPARKVLRLKHRSAYTHGPLVPLIVSLIVLSLPVEKVLLDYALVGFCTAYAVHLAFDIFPQKWHGSAKISFAPFAKKRISASGSRVWLFTGILASVYALLFLIYQVQDIFILVIVIVISVFKRRRREKSFFGPLLVLALGAGITYLFVRYLNR